MKIKEIAEAISADVICGEERMDDEIISGCGADLMSDVLAFTKHDAMLLTGLTNAHVVRTAEMMDITCVVFVRGKMPPEEVVELAKSLNLVLMSTKLPMFAACGILYEKGLRGGIRED